MPTHDPEPKQTTPKGVEIPVPKREDVRGNLAEVAQPEKDSKKP